MAKKSPYSVYSRTMDMAPIFHGSYKSKKLAAQRVDEGKAASMTARWKIQQEEDPKLTIGSRVAKEVIPNL